MNKLKLSIIVSAAVVATVSCASQYDLLLSSTDVDKKYEAAFDYFNAGKYQKAASLFESLSVQTNGTPREDTVLYYWGLSNYRFKDFYTAETNFTNFLTNFPRSPFTSEATFLRIDCLYRSTYRYELDQTPTKTAISAIEQYRTDHPGNDHGEACEAMLTDLNERLDKKAFESAKLYYRMEDYKAAQVALKNVLKEDSDNIYREDVLYYTAMASYKYANLSVEAKQKDRYLTFADDYFNFIGEYPDSPYRKELDTLYRRSQRALGRYTGSDEDLEQKEKDFARERRALVKENETSGGKGE